MLSVEYCQQDKRVSVKNSRSGSFSLMTVDKSTKKDAEKDRRLAPLGGKARWKLTFSMFYAKTDRPNLRNGGILSSW